MSEISRRTVLIGAAVTPLAGCSPPGPAPATPAPEPGQQIVAVADVPVGSGTIAHGTLVTQPTAGVFKGFIARCTHAGCALSAVNNGAALCPCHGSSFGLNGQVLRGPATEPLRARPVSVKGGMVIADRPGES